MALALRLVCGAALAAALLAAADPAAAQPAKPAAAGAPPAFVLPPLRDLGPGPAAAWAVSRVVFEGNRAIATADLDAIAAPFSGRTLRGVEVEELRQRITRAYIDRGYVSSGALIPDNALGSDGTLRIRIVEGTVAQVRLTGMARLSDAYVASRLARPGEALNANVLQERFQLLLADPLFDKVNARLLPGSELGSSIIDAEITRARPLRVTLFANNHLAPAVGSAPAGVEAVVRNLSGWGDALGATVSESRGSASWDVSWSLPLFARSTTLALRRAHGNSSVIEEPVSELEIGSVIDTREVTLTHPLIDQTRRRLALGLTYTERSNSTTLGGQRFSFVTGGPRDTPDEVKAVRFFQDLVARFDRHVLALRSTFAAGRNNLPDTPLLSEQPSRKYRLWTGQAQASIALGEGGTQLLLRGLVQRAADHLVPLEQISIGGRHTVRGYRENQLVRDNGHALSAEVHYPLYSSESPRQTLALIPFIDAGGAHNRGEARSRLASAGAGLQWTIADLEAEIFVAKRLEKRAVSTHEDLQDRGIHIALRYRLY